MNRNGRNLTEQQLKGIIRDYFISKHAMERLKQRSQFVVRFNCGEINYKETKENINNALKNNVLMYFNTDGSVNIAINEYEYFVFVYDFHHKDWELITFKEKSHNSITIFEKQQMAIRGCKRK